MNMVRDIKSDPQASAVSPEQFRQVMGTFATGIAVITVGTPGGSRTGITVNSFNTVSLAPPLILWSIALKAPSLETFRRHDHFAVNILSAGQKDVALQFARPSEDKFASVETETGEYGMPLIAGALAHVECRAANRYPGGDHEIVIGEVLRSKRTDREPLIYHCGAFATLQGLS